MRTRMAAVVGVVVMGLACGGVPNEEAAVQAPAPTAAPDWCKALTADEQGASCTVVDLGATRTVAGLNVAVISAVSRPGDAALDEYDAEKLAEVGGDTLVVTLKVKSELEETAEPEFGMYLLSGATPEKRSNLSTHTKKLAADEGMANLWDDREFEAGQTRKVPLISAVPKAEHAQAALVLDHTDDDDATHYVVFPLELG